MSDLVKKLRKLSVEYTEGSEFSPCETIYGEAADLIEQQQRELERVEDQLNKSMQEADTLSDDLSALRKKAEEQEKVINHIHASVGHQDDRPMDCWQSVDHVVSVAEEIKQERDALAAHVERLRNEINTTVLDAVNQYDDKDNGYWIITLEQLEALKEVDDQSPQTSLAEHDAEVVLKAIGDVCDEMSNTVEEKRKTATGATLASLNHWRNAIHKLRMRGKKYANKIQNGESDE